MNSDKPGPTEGLRSAGARRQSAFATLGNSNGGFAFNDNVIKEEIKIQRRKTEVSSPSKQDGSSQENNDDSVDEDIKNLQEEFLNKEIGFKNSIRQLEANILSQKNKMRDETTRLSLTIDKSRNEYGHL